MLGAALTCASCGGDGGGSNNPNPSPSPTPNPPTDNSVIIRIIGQSGSFSFTPNPASAGGQPVRFRNETSETHNVILNDGSITIPNIAPGATSSAVTMPSAGTNYHCSLHTNMGGAISGAGNAPPPPCEGAYCY
jgi:plastocyanin